MNDESLSLIKSRRSFIFTPATNPRMHLKAISSGADIVCIELEDGIAPHEKTEARENGIKLLADPAEFSAVEHVIRINSTRTKFGIEDIHAITQEKSFATTIMLPKVKNPEEVKWLDALLSDLESKANIQVIIETNEGLDSCFEIAHASDRLSALFFGGFDMAADLRCENKWESLLYARSKIVHAAASAQLDCLDVPYLNLQNQAGLEKEARLAKELGFTGKGAIHPKQIPIINDIFTPSKKEIDRALQIIDAFKSANTGLVVVDGKLIEKPVIREMQRILSIATRIN